MTCNVLNSQRLNDTEPTNEAIYSSHGRTTKTMCLIWPLLEHNSGESMHSYYCIACMQFYLPRVLWKLKMQQQLRFTIVNAASEKLHDQKFKTVPNLLPDLNQTVIKY